MKENINKRIGIDKLMTNKKINIEFIRIFAIFFTIMIHVSNVYIYNFEKIDNLDFFISVIYNSFARICVPLFFMISGIFLIKQEYNKEKYIKRIKKYIFLLIVWSIIYYLINNNFNIINFSSTIVNSIVNAYMTSRHLWFMYAIIGLYIALPFIQSMCKNLTKEQENIFIILWTILSGSIVIFIPLARIITKTNIDISYPIPIINSAYYLGYFISGYIIYERLKEHKTNKKHNIFLILFYVLSSLIKALSTYFITIAQNKVFDTMMWYRSIFIVIASISIFSLIIINESKIKNPIILKLSKYSFGIYLIHMIFLKIIKSNINIISLNPIIFIPLITIIIYILSLLSCIIIK